MKPRSFTAALLFLSAALMNAAAAQGGKPTIVLVHGAFAESSSWNGVVAELLADGYPVVAAANPLRGLQSDADYVSSVIKSVQGPIVLVGHSYGGSVISNVHGEGKVKAHVYVAAFALEQGESTVEMSNRYPGGTLGPTLAAPVSSSKPTRSRPAVRAPTRSAPAKACAQARSARQPRCRCRWRRARPPSSRSARTRPRRRPTRCRPRRAPRRSPSATRPPPARGPRTPAT